jgi:hypothetical protein
MTMHRYTSLDGAVVELEMDHPVSDAHTSIANFAIGEHIQEFTAGRRGLGDDIAAHFGLRLSESRSFSGGTLRLGQQRIVDPQGMADFLTLGVWQGQRCDLVTHRYGVSGLADAAATFERFVVKEGSDVVLEPKKGLARPMGESCVAQELPGLGLLDISPLTQKAMRSLPPWRGTKMRHGELYEDQHPDGSSYFVFVTESVKCTILPDDATAADRVPSVVRNASAAWRAAG